MTSHATGTREEWIDARLKLLEAEKNYSRMGDALAKQRQALPWVRIDKDYRLETDDGPLSLADLFRGRSQLITYHFMFGPDYTAGCPSCSAIADGFNGIVTHLENHDVSFCAVSRAPLPRLQEYKQRMGWTFPWYSSHASDFNYDFSASFTRKQQLDGAEYNFRRDDPQMLLTVADAVPPMFIDVAAMVGADVPTYFGEREGLSAFALQDGAVHHTYSAYARGVDPIWSVYPWLERAPKGRNENGYWWKRRDEYGKPKAASA